MSNDAILKYLISRYDPTAVLLYGSFADGTNNDGSDFDALVISPHTGSGHDGSAVAGTPLDVFLCTSDEARKPENIRKFLGIYDAKVLLDRDGSGQRLKERVREFVRVQPKKTQQEKEHLRGWCRKMAVRARRGDAEGYFRWHWLLSDSLEIYCDLRGEFYFGPKKTIHKMEEEDMRGFSLLNAALSSLNEQALCRWVDYLTQI